MSVLSNADGPGIPQTLPHLGFNFSFADPAVQAHPHGASFAFEAPDPAVNDPEAVIEGNSGDVPTVITLILRPFLHNKFHRLVRAGDPLWVRRFAANWKSEANQVVTGVTQWQLNRILREAYVEAVKLLAPWLATNAGTSMGARLFEMSNAAFAEHYLRAEEDANAREQRSLSLLHLDNTTHAAQKLVNRHYERAALVASNQTPCMDALTTMGVTRRWTFVGFITDEPITAATYDEVNTTSGSMARAPTLSVTTRGRQLVTNVWGSEATAGRGLHFVTKRVFDRSSGTYGPMAVHAEVSKFERLEDSQLVYQDYSGCVALGEARKVARCDKPKGLALAPHFLPTLQGLTSDPVDVMYERNTATPKLGAIVAPRHHGRAVV